MVQPGDRVRLISTDDQYTSLSSGAEGVVKSIDYLPPEITGGPRERQIWIKWDSGAKLVLIPEAGDQFEIIERADTDADQDQPADP